jgi:transposase-like protein
MHGKKFNDEFKLETIKLIIEYGGSVRELSIRIVGVPTSSLYQ